MPRFSRCNRLSAAASIIPPQATVSALIETALVPPRAGLAGDRATRQMAEDMRSAGHREGGMSRDDLELLGWTAAQIDSLAAKARTRAQALAGAGI